MKVVPLVEVAEVNPRSDAISGDTEVSFVGMADLDATTARTTAGQTRRFADVSKGYTVFRDRDILLAKITPCFENCKIGQAQLSNKIGVGSTEFHVVRPSDGLLDRYLLHYLRQDWVRVQGESRMTGSGGQRRVPADYIKALRLPLPALEEQRRIATILDQADELRAQRRAALGILASLPEAVFIDMFGDPIRNPKGWPVRPFEDAIDTMQYGPRFYNESYSPDGVRIVRITDLDQYGHLDFDSMPRMDVGDDEVKKFGLTVGDIVFARTGATVGKLAVIRDGDPVCIAGAYFIRIRLKDAVEPDYVATALRSRAIQSIIVAGSHQSAQQNFSGPGLRALRLPFPPADIQRQFSSVLSGLVEHAVPCIRAASELDALFASLQSRAFSGLL